MAEKQTPKKKRWRTLWNFSKHLFEINWRLFWGMWQLTRLPQPAVTVFGGSRIPKDSPYAKQAQELTRRLAEDGFSIITGGGPGIMEAANRGAFEYSKEDCKDPKCDHKRCKRQLVSMGIGVTGLSQEKLNPYIHDQIIMDHFFTRKWMLVRYSIGFIVFPGGFGTLDELFEIITLIQTEFMQEMPIVLMGKDYWQPLLQWIDAHVVKRGLAAPTDASLMHVADSVDDAFEFLTKKCRECMDR